MHQPGKVANPARGQLNRENNIPLSPCVPENLVSRDGFSRPVPRQPAHLHTQAESGAYLRDSSRVPRRRSFIYFKPPYAIGSVPSLSGHAIVYRWRSLPIVRRHRASKPHGSSERVLPWQVTKDQFICASLSHTHYWYFLYNFRFLFVWTIEYVVRSFLPMLFFYLVAKCCFLDISLCENSINQSINIYQPPCSDADDACIFCSFVAQDLNRYDHFCGWVQNIRVDHYIRPEVRVSCTGSHRIISFCTDIYMRCVHAGISHVLLCNMVITFSRRV